MRRFFFVLVAVATSASFLAPVPAVEAAAAIGSADVVYDSDRTGNWEIYVEGPDGQARQLTEDPATDAWWPKISPDRTKLLFYRTPRGVHDTDFEKTSLWVMDADGSNERRLIARGAFGWDLHGHAEWSPDGTKIVMFGGDASNPHIFITDHEGRNPVAVTDGLGTNIDPSWSPDGSEILYIGCPIDFCMPLQYEVYRTTATPASPTKVDERLTHDFVRDHDPYYSPDGTKIAWLRQSLNFSLYVMEPDGQQQRPVVEDLGVNSKPGWSLDSQWIYFHRLTTGHTAFTIWKVRPSGEDLTALHPLPPITINPYGEEFPVNSSF